MNTYYFSVIINDTFESAIEKTVQSLQNHSFGVLTEIDVKATLNKKLNVDFKNYRILGACHPPSAYKALSAEDKIGTMLPCNVIVQELEPGKIEIAAIDPIASMMAVQNPSLGDIAIEVRAKLKSVIDSIK